MYKALFLAGWGVNTFSAAWYMSEGAVWLPWHTSLSTWSYRSCSAWMLSGKLCWMLPFEPKAFSSSKWTAMSSISLSPSLWAPQGRESQSLALSRSLLAAGLLTEFCCLGKGPRAALPHSYPSIRTGCPDCRLPKPHLFSSATNTSSQAEQHGERAAGPLWSWTPLNTSLGFFCRQELGAKCHKLAAVWLSVPSCKARSSPC